MAAGEEEEEAEEDPSRPPPLLPNPLPPLEPWESLEAPEDRVLPV